MKSFVQRPNMDVFEDESKLIRERRELKTKFKAALMLSPKKEGFDFASSKLTTGYMSQKDTENTTLRAIISRIGDKDAHMPNEHSSVISSNLAINIAHSMPKELKDTVASFKNPISRTNKAKGFFATSNHGDDNIWNKNEINRNIRTSDQ
jgi:hypothetical protein